MRWILISISRSTFSCNVGASAINSRHLGDVSCLLGHLCAAKIILPSEINLRTAPILGRSQGNWVSIARQSNNPDHGGVEWKWVWVGVLDLMSSYTWGPITAAFTVTKKDSRWWLKIVSDLMLRSAAVQITGKCATSAKSVVIFDHFALGLLQNSGGQMFSPSAFLVKPWMELLLSLKVTGEHLCRICGDGQQSVG